ncbi:hypothetical protein [Niabella hibiscisoli]|uniref:hypothetical protein n=1 Tax=Niabella hibiscisoli TaxID=1825928 RepID=UPI001F0DDF0E|nr:hypothetical protein [Niabella hibiscisoli]MCH5719869.1 hypothetical protein [Niabella hibiscisoli]
MKSVSSIAISFDHIEAELQLYVDARQPNTLFDAEGSAVAYNEARFQLVEGCFYDFTWSHPAYRLGDIGANIITPHKRNLIWELLPPIFL